MKPLYLLGRDIRIERDGPALRVAGIGRADCWFPLRRISRVVSATRVDWSTGALLACAESGITVSFLNEDGAVLARLLGRPRERVELRQRWADFLLRPDWRMHYGQWLAAMERMAVRSVIRRAGIAWPGTEPAKSLRRGFHEAAQAMGLLPAFERIGGEVHGLTVALASQRLADAGVAGDFEGGEGPELAMDFATILFWDFQLVRMAWLEDRLRDELTGIPDRQELVAFFEAHRPRTERLAAGIINRLHHWLMELH